MPMQMNPDLRSIIHAYMVTYCYASKCERVFGSVLGTHFARTSVVGDALMKTMNF